MRRFFLGLVCVLSAVGSTSAGVEVAAAGDASPADVIKILHEAQMTAHQISSPSDRNAALTAVGQTLILAGDESGAMVVDKKIATGEMPRPILKSLALAQLQTGRIDDALFTIQSMHDQEAADTTLMALAESADNLGDVEMAVRLCKLVAGESRLDALLYAARIQHAAADLDGADTSLDAAKVLAHHQPEVARVAETEALLGNLEHADRLMGRLRRENDQSRVLAAIVSVEATAKDFASADSHASDINVDSYKSIALGAIGMAHAQLGQVKEAVEQINAIPDDDVKLNFERALTELELKTHGIEAGRAIAVGCKETPAKAVCLSVVAMALAKAGNVETARKTMLEAQSTLFPEHELPSDAAVGTVADNMAAIDMPAEAMALAAKVRETDLRIDKVRSVLRTVTRLHDTDAARKLLESLKDPREKAAGLVGIAQGLLDGEGVARDPS